MMVRFSGLLSRPESGSLRRAVHKLSQQKHIGFVGEFPTHINPDTQRLRQKSIPRHRRPDDANLNRTPAPLGLCPAVEAPQQSAPLRRVEQYCWLDKSYLSSCLVPTCSSPLWSFIFCSFGLSSLLPPPSFLLLSLLI
jgi:hypothetical protein